jgi:hypothetical protein
VVVGVPLLVDDDDDDDDELERLDASLDDDELADDEVGDAPAVVLDSLLPALPAATPTSSAANAMTATNQSATGCFHHGVRVGDGSSIDTAPGGAPGGTDDPGGG